MWIKNAPLVGEKESGRKNIEDWGRPLEDKSQGGKGVIEKNGVFFKIRRGATHA